MIPRTVRRLETTLLPYSRQCLPRPARLYSSPSKRANAPALATAHAIDESYPAFMPTRQEDIQPGPSVGMRGLTKSPPKYTILPTPLPEDAESSPINDFYFTDSPTQDSLAIIDACLRDSYDVPRAQRVFNELRVKRAGDPILVPQLYNTLLSAYVDMAARNDAEHWEKWLGDAIVLFQTMQAGTERVRVTAGSYAIMLLAWIQFNEKLSLRTFDAPALHLPSPGDLVSLLDEQGISATAVVTDRAISTAEDATKIARLILSTAVEQNRDRLVLELREVEAIAKHPDPFADVPEAMPVMRPRETQERDATADEGEEISPTTDDVMEVPFNLDVLRRHLARVKMARQVLPENVLIRQKVLEDSAIDVARERIAQQARMLAELGNKDQALNRHGLQRWMWEWHTKLQDRLAIEINALLQHEQSLKIKPGKDQQLLGPFLQLLKPETMSLITILELMRMSGTGGVSDGMKMARALLTVGTAIEAEYHAQLRKKNNMSVPSQSMRPGQVAYFTGQGYQDLYARRIAARKYMEDNESWSADWSQTLKVRIASFLVDNLIDIATVTRRGIDKTTGEEIEEVQPAFFHSYEYVHGHKLGVIKLNSMVAERLASDDIRDTVPPRNLPMLVKPKPWLDYNDGAYLNIKTKVMRFKESQEQEVHMREAARQGKIELIFAALDVLGSTPWVINRPVFDIVLNIWNSGGRFAKIPPAVFDMPEPEKPADWLTNPKARNVYLMRVRAYHQAKGNNHSERCSVNYKMEIARTFIGDTFYLPHNIDFRGRAYPIPPHLSHIGDDLSRGLLKFAEAKPLGARGLRWLKIHLANLYGFDKGNFEDRVIWAEQNLDNIYDSAERPLEGKRWWTKADDPWQCLATCMELRNALKSGDPLAYECALPVHQDGTCNGLQHYAALGGDEKGARQVNLDVTDRPSDVYTYVADMVEAQLEREKDTNKYAAMLVGKIARKVVKQTVMTTVYGVTFIGAREQIEKQLKDREEIPEEECWAASSYLAKNVLAAIGDLFSGAKDIQVWLNMCARLITKSIPPERIEEASKDLVDKRGKKKQGTRAKKEQMTSMIWTSPMNLPIVQPYRKTKRKQIMTAIQSVFISDPNSPAEVNSMKQASAFPPNFIHSLDASHMMKTALRCRDEDITFASVHDSYWTHACDIDRMSAIIRDTFVDLHTGEVLKKLHDEFLYRYKDYKIPLGVIRSSTLIRKLRNMGVTPPPVMTAIEEMDAAIRAGSENDDIEVAEADIDAAETDVEAEVIDVDAQSAEDTQTLEDAIDITAATRRKRIRPTIALNKTYVELADLIPPVPQKGDFDVNTIKKSLYFFS
ncbi:DNA/RNA polymerase [Neolentinus lepideus HHB14362 ss-1]|uniref:DNA-directed RNA polymerase n=1 Tax=Neolentinus lepideus HHB14362 ss-1 TaxID=1314782 RepID=A0A165SEL1_9AGAM|nr:DNA/RNA polymerase [Neolentinus lepideus HHB14362 ss-1]